MNRWRYGMTVTKKAPRRVFWMHGRPFVYVSEHPLEERICELTADYRDADGDFILPEPVAWDGVETHPGLFIGLP